MLSGEALGLLELSVSGGHTAEWSLAFDNLLSTVSPRTSFGNPLPWGNILVWSNCQAQNI